MKTVTDRVQAADAAAKRLQRLSAQARSSALHAVAGVLAESKEQIAAANKRDLERAEAENISLPLLKRLRFDEEKLTQAVCGVVTVADLPDIVGAVHLARELDEDLVLYRKSSPIGVLAMVFESRPDALVQIASLAIKSGNALVLKGGSEAKESNRILADTIARASVEAGLPEGWIQLLETREDVAELLHLDQFVDLLIPRGSNEFVRHIMDNTNIPVMGHADGICHVFVDASADPEKSERIVVDSKTQYVAVCNAAETLLVHASAAPHVLPRLSEALSSAGVELRGCAASREIVPAMEPASDEDWAAEYLDLILSVRVVESLEEAIDHVNRFGSGHTDAIITEDRASAEQFMQAVDSASVVWNASTRFADGFRYGLGAEVGISTGKIHARGPVGVEGLLSYKWELHGNGHIVADYSGTGARRFTHRDLQRDL